MSKASTQIATIPVPAATKVSARVAASMVVPAIIADAGETAARRFLEFFAATIRNKNTRMASYRAVCQFFAWCDKHELGGIDDIEPLHVSAYIESQLASYEKPAVKQHLAAIRMLFDWLVIGQVLAVNPATSGSRPEARRQARQDDRPDR